MSVPVRYSAAANYAVVESGLSNTLQQEEQYHQQQQQQQELYCQLYNSNSNNINNNSNISNLEQQQLMQQRSSMSSSVSPSLALPNNPTTTTTITNMTTNLTNINTNTNIIAINNNIDSTIIMDQGQGQEQHGQDQDQDQNRSLPLSSSSPSSLTTTDELSENSENHDMEEVKLMTASTMVAAAAAAAANGSDNAEMRTEWMSDEGRYGTPGAAGLEYQKFELEQQKLQQEQQDQQRQQEQQRQCQQATAMGNNNDHPMKEPLPMDNEKKTANVKELEELFTLTTEVIYARLKEYYVLQDKYYTILMLPRESKREVTAGGRDGSAYVLRCLKIWYELPSDVLFNAMSLVDRFLDRMTVKPKHMACMSVASLFLAIKQFGLKPIPAEELVTISQCGCTAGDLERMAGVIETKLDIPMHQKPITTVNFLRIYYVLFYNLAKDLGGNFFDFYRQYIKLEDLENRSEVLLCDVQTSFICPSTLALVLICLHLDFHIKESSYTRGTPELRHVFEYILFLQQFLKIPDSIFTTSFSKVAEILSHYNGQNKQPYKQRLVWKLSSRTLRVLRPTKCFSSDLPTIEEGISNTMDDSCRSRTESISSEEEEDWPTSPIIPIFEQC